MGKSTLTVLLVEDSSQYANLVQHWLSGAAGDTEFLLNWTDSLTAGLSRLEKGGIDLVLLDLGLPDCNGVETFAQARARSPKVPIVILSSADSESLALQLILEGAEDYLVKSTCDGDALVRAVRHAVVRRKSQRSAPPVPSIPSRVIGVVGTKGGVGTTTIACSLAAELRHQTNQKVLLADLDADGGNISFLTGIESKYSIVDAARNLQRLDQQCWASIVAEAQDGLQVVSSGGFQGGELETGNLRQVLAFAQPLYPWIVMDLGRPSRNSIAVLDLVSDVFAVTTTTIPALYETKRVVGTLHSEAIDPNRLRLIVNHLTELQSLSRGDLNTMLGVPVHATIPNDGDELRQAYIEKRLPSRNSRIQKAIAGLARKLTGVPEQTQRRKLPSLVSLADRFRKTTAGAAVSVGQ